MIRTARARLAACLSTGLLAGSLPALALLAAPTAQAAAAAEPSLEVSIDSLTPAVVPRGGPVVVTGQVRNRSQEEWSDLKVYLLTSEIAMTTAEELSDAAQSPTESEFGSRLTGAGSFAEVGDLAPGETISYRVRVPRGQLAIGEESGVYWLGVHVLGANAEGRDTTADARARLFVPLMAPNGPRTRLSLVLPVKGRVSRDGAGRLSGLDLWQGVLSDEGRLGRLVDLANTGAGQPLTLVVDPAVLDAAVSVARDNPGRSIAPTTSEPPAPSESAGDAASGSSSDSPSASAPTDPDATGDDPSGSPDSPDPETSPRAQEASRWVSSFSSLAAGHTTLSVPYGDLDVSAVLREQPRALYRRAVELSAVTLAALGISAQPVVAPASGFLTQPALRRLPATTPVVLSSHAAPRARTPAVTVPHGHTVVLTEELTEDDEALVMRQRVLAEAAVHALGDSADQPLVVSMPQRWDPGGEWRQASFFTGLDQPWLQEAGLPPLLSGLAPEDPPVSRYDRRLVYPPGERRAELPAANLAAARELDRTGRRLAGLLTANNTIDQEAAKQAMLAASVRARKHPGIAAERVSEATEQLRSLMRKVRIEGPSFVTMSSETGTFAVTVVNDLPEPVTVGIRADTGSRNLVIASPDPVELGPGQRASVRLSATSKNIGVHSVDLQVTTTEGQPLGGSAQFSVRSSQVGLVIWVIMGIGGAVLFVAVVLRIVRRVRQRTSAHEPALGGRS